MPGLSRRRFLAASAATAGAAVVGAGSASAATPRQHNRRRRYGDLRDIEHVVILMQENRSFDHYFGTLRGVRGFGDRSTITLPGGYSVFQQPIGVQGLPTVLTHYPWHLSEAPAEEYPGYNRPSSGKRGAQGYGGTSHSWDDQHGAWAGGLMNGWVEAKLGLTTLGYLDRSDIPFHYALADLYTVGDAYHCSVLSSTGPNRTYLWGGTVDAAQKHSGYTAFEGADELGRFLPWESYAETLQKAGVSWRLYQCIDNYGDAGLQYFKTFAELDPDQGGKAAPGNPYYEGGVARVPEPVTGISANADNLANAIRADVKAGTLPRVSWVVTNQAFSEHPDGAPNDGAYFVNGVLEALNADPDVFNSTLVIINYDENDGQFDHVPPPVSPPDTTDEWYDELLGSGGYGILFGGNTNAVPVGLGFRVPLILVSPWTRGGWVTSEVCDHTSVLQFLEKWTSSLGKPAICPNISAWRRKVCGDLTRAFDFDAPVYGLPRLPATSVTGDPPGDGYSPPVVSNRMPRQEPGTRPARPLPYQPNANLVGVRLGLATTTVTISFSNNGPHVAKASHFAVYNNASLNPSYGDYPRNAPSQHTVDPVRDSAKQAVTADVELFGIALPGRYDVTVIGPNRFLRHFTGNALTGDATSQVSAEYYPRGLHHDPVLDLHLRNAGKHPVTFSIRSEHYGRPHTARVRVPAGSERHHLLDPVAASHGWYDVTVTITGDESWSRRYVGHLETGRPSITGS
ncbi:MAG TPA: phospholipase C, phosphocholine-specific [Mycobacteriales bacterium]|nr:phospholipase C, phosphocholine-specific [Mycobacteriales bacterium]